MDNFHEVWNEQMRLIGLAMDRAQPLLDTLKAAIAHAPTQSGREQLDELHDYLATTLNHEAAGYGLGKVIL